MNQYEFFSKVCLDENGLICGLTTIIQKLEEIKEHIQILGVEETTTTTTTEIVTTTTTTEMVTTTTTTNCMKKNMNIKVKEYIPNKNITKIRIGKFN